MNEQLLQFLNGDKARYPHNLDQQFARIVNKIVELWNTPALDAYFNELMIDTRSGTRKGFPAEIASEIFSLSQFYDQLHRQAGIRADDPWSNIDIRKQAEIESLGYRCTPQDFFKSAETNNRTAVGLYLGAGFPVDLKDERGWTPLMISSFNGNEEIAELLIRSGADVHIKDNGGYSPIHWAAYNGYANVIKLLIIRDAEVNARNQHGWTALLQAATRGHLSACGILIAGGANVNLPSNDGWTPLHKASANGHLEVAKLLLSLGADRNAKYQDGITPLALANKGKHHAIAALLSG